MQHNNAKIIHLISDLHLSEEQPNLFRLLEHYINNIAVRSEQLFVLGDLFELWVGDDHLTPFNQSVIELFAGYSGELFFAHGNRDFLLGNHFAKACGGILIDEPYHFEWENKKVSLMHGDSLCTDDVAYQQLRNMVRNPQWQKEFLSQPVEARLAFADSVREQSKNSQKQKTAEIMDVNQSSVSRFVEENQCDWLIHGHTHRPASHQIKYNDGKICERLVLSDWRDKGHYLELRDNQLNNTYFQY